MIYAAVNNLAILRASSGQLVDQSVAASFQAGATIQTPPMLERNIDRLFMLGDVAGPNCLHLVRLLMQYNTTVKAARFVCQLADVRAPQGPRERVASAD